jgi:hypothetical protein
VDEEFIPDWALNDLKDPGVMRAEPVLKLLNYWYTRQRAKEIPLRFHHFKDKGRAGILMISHDKTILSTEDEDADALASVVVADDHQDEWDDIPTGAPLSPRSLGTTPTPEPLGAARSKTAETPSHSITPQSIQSILKPIAGGKGKRRELAAETTRRVSRREMHLQTDDVGRALEEAAGDESDISGGDSEIDWDSGDSTCRGETVTLTTTPKGRYVQLGWTG